MCLAKTIISNQNQIVRRVALFVVAVALIQFSSTSAVEFIEIIEGEDAQGRVNNHNANGMRLEHFNQWVFNNQTELPAALDLLLGRLKSEADSVQKTCQLEDTQRDSLILAGQGDIYDFALMYKEIHAKFANDLEKNNQEDIQNIWQSISPLKKKYQGDIYGKSSLFGKVLGNLLTKRQTKLLEDYRREQRKFIYRTSVMQLVQELDEVSPLLHSKRERLIVLIEQCTVPPKSVDTSNIRHYLPYYVFLQMNQIPEKDLKPLLENRGWKILQKQIELAKRMERQLIMQGLVPDQEDEFTRLKDASTKPIIQLTHWS